MYPEWRHRSCALWWDCLAIFTMMLDAAGWESDKIADLLGRPAEDIEAILNPILPVRGREFTVWENGGCLLGTDEPGEQAQVAAYYADSVEIIVAGWLERACSSAVIRCKIDGFDNVEPILRDRERRYRRQREAAERRGGDTLAFLTSDFQDGDLRQRGGIALVCRLGCSSCRARKHRRGMGPRPDGMWPPPLRGPRGDRLAVVGLADDDIGFQPF